MQRVREQRDRADCLTIEADERRGSTRFRARGVAEFRVLPLGEARPAVLLDLSASGCSIEAPETFPASEHTPVDVILNMKGAKLRVGGEVRHFFGRRRVGIEFLDVSERRAAQIEELVEELLERARRHRERHSRL
jgi:c-di-GMP-binding flagellar brake protein YcgR